MNYIYGWFSIDFLSIFPFHAMVDSGVFTKLIRLLRMPRLIKLLDVERFKSIIKSFESESDGHGAIIK